MQDLLNPSTPAGAYDQFLPAARERARTRAQWTTGDGPLPALFVSHGAPPTLDDSAWLTRLFDWGQKLPTPRAILVISAHWENAPLSISSIAAGTPLFYDFGGFHQRYYTLPYATPDATDLARRVVGAFPDTTIHHHTHRGLDHGAFIPLMAMYPLADVPVLQLSLPNLAPTALLDLGQRLKSLREEGVLIVGSGFMTHGMGRNFNPASPQQLLPFNADFDAWAADALARGDIDALADFRTKAPGAAHAHPSSEHFVPLLVTLGAATHPERSPITEIEGAVFGNSKRSIQAY